MPKTNQSETSMDIAQLLAEYKALRDREYQVGREALRLVELLKGAAPLIHQAALDVPLERREDAAHAYRLTITAIDQLEGINDDGELSPNALSLAARRVLGHELPGA